MSGERDAVAVKAARLLAAGSVSIGRVDPGVVDAEVVGHSGTHHVSWRDFDSWWCDCEAFRFRRRCSHQSAVARVAVCLVRDQLANTMQQGPES